MKSASNQITQEAKGFTLIELVMVIVILGVLSAFALPRFADFGGDARSAVRQGILGSMKSSAAIAHTKCLADSTCDPADSSQSVKLEGQTVRIVYGYPSASDAGIGAAAQLDPETTSGGGPQRPTRPGPPYTVTIDNRSNCTITYGEARSTGSGPSCSGETDCK